MHLDNHGKKKIIFIIGPTAIGKTRLSVKLAKKINGEIISADSMQVYKHMPVLSQAPSRIERECIRHHLVETLEPTREYSVANFIAEASKRIALMLKRGKAPIVVGGSGLYIKGLVDGLFPSPRRNLRYRKSMELFAKRHGLKKLHDKLKSIDPEAADTIHPNDLRRIVRALEICKSTGRTMTELKLRTKGLKDMYDIRIFGLIKKRQDIYASIDRRVDKMFGTGLVKEVKRLKAIRLSRTAGGILGYKEIIGYIKGDYDKEAASELLKKNTRRFAKKQLTWFRADKRIRWIDMNRRGTMAIIKKIIRESK